MDDFKLVIGVIFNNWTALKMALDNGFGGPGPECIEKTLGFIELLNNKYHQGCDHQEVEDEIVEYMNSEYNTILEDESEIEIAYELGMLFNLWREQKFDEIRLIISRQQSQVPIQEVLIMPSKPPVQYNENIVPEQPISEPSEWTEVRRRR